MNKKQPSGQILVALADDHALLRNALSMLIDGFGNCKVILQCSNGQELCTQIGKGLVPDLVLLDLNMPEMNGYETAARLQKEWPAIHVLMLTMYDSELSMIKLLQSGVKGFLKKDIPPAELKFALQSVMESGYYYSNNSTGKLVNLFRRNDEGGLLQRLLLNEQEIQFLQLACSDMTYKEIAQKMGLNPRTVDTLRDQLFMKMDVRSRVGLAMVAIKQGIVTL